MTNKPPATEGQAAGLAEFVLVPREPTPEWIKDMDVHLLSKYGAELGPAVAREMIANVLAAAPSSASSGETGKPRAIANRMREIIQDVWDKKEGYTDRQAWSDLHGQALQLLGWEVASREALATPEQKPVMVLVTEAMVERLAVELARASLAEALPDREEVPMALVEPVIANYRNVARKALEATLSVPAAEQKAEPVARKRFPILKGDGATIDWQLVEDHGGQAQQNHYQTVHRLAERGGLSWSELHAVLHNQRYRDMDANEAMLACRALEARYLAAIAPSTQADQKAEPVRKVQKMARFCAEIAWDTAFAWAIDHGRTDQEAYNAASSVRENVLVHALQDDALSTQAIEARNAVIEEAVKVLSPMLDLQTSEIAPMELNDEEADIWLRGHNTAMDEAVTAIRALRAAEARQL